jgi:hypothetical protein
MVIDFLALAQACRDAATGRLNTLPVEAFNTLLIDFYAHGETFGILTEAMEPLFVKLEEVSATEPQNVLRAVAETLRSRQKQPGPVCTAFRRFATVLELAHQLQEILHEHDADLPALPVEGPTTPAPDVRCEPTDQDNLPVSDMRNSRTDNLANASGSLHDS